MRRRLRETGVDVDEEEPEDVNLMSKSRPRSGLNRLATELVRKEMLWPHLFVFRHKGSERVPATYSQLSMAEFTHGLFMTLLKENNEDTRYLMIRYMAEMYKDAANSTWGSVKDFHAAVLHDMETGDLAWED